MKTNSILVTKYISSLFSIFFVLGMAHNGLAQKKKGPYVEIDNLIKTEKFDEAEPKLVSFNKQFPHHALSHFWLARIYKQQFEGTYVHKSDDLSNKYDNALLLFEKARGLINKRELKLNRSYYDEMFGRKNYSEASIQAYIDEFVQSMQGYYTKIAQIRIRFISIPSNYEFCQQAFVQIVGNYKSTTDMYLHIDDRDIVKLGNIERWQNNMTEAISNYNDFFRKDRFASQHQQQFKFTQIEGLKSYRVDKKDFEKKEIKLFDYGTWATKMKQEIERVKKIQHEAIAIHDTLSYFLNLEQLPKDFSLNLLDIKLSSWKKQLLQVDESAGKLIEWFDYRFNRLSFNYLEQKAQKDFAITYPTKAERDERIDELVKILVNLNQEVQKLDIRVSSYQNYQGFVAKYIGNQASMAQFKVLEENFITEKLREWNVVRVKMPDIAPIYPDSITHNGQRIVLRPAKMNMKVLLDSGFYLTEQVYACIDSGFIIRGKYQITDGERVFIGKISRKGKVQWLKPFQKTSEEFINKLEKITPYNNGMTLLFAHAQRTSSERLKMLVLSDSGTVIMERLVGEIPDNMYLSQTAPGVLFFKQAPKIANMLDGFEKYEVTGYRFDGKKTIANDILIRGQLVDIVEVPKGIKFVANFLEFQDLNGQFYDSRAYTKGGYNVLVGEIYLTDDKQSKITPIYSLKPIAVSKVESKPEGHLILYGVQGEFEYNSTKSIIGGDVWEVLFE